MNKELCFLIDSKNIYLEQILVDYMNVPIFFLCSDENEYYVALCTDMDEFSYIVVKVSLMDVVSLLHGNLPMRDIILKQEFYWDIESGEEINSDIVIKRTMKEINFEVLPEANACFKILTEEVRTFVQKFDANFYATKYFSNNAWKAEINDCFSDSFTDAMLNTIEPFTELVDYRIKRTMIDKMFSYNDEMKPVLDFETSSNNALQPELVKIDSSFTPVEIYVKNMIIAA